MQASEFFYSLTPERILDAVEALGLKCTGKLLPLNSVENRVYDVEIDLHDHEVQSKYDISRIVKFYRPGRWTREQILEEHQFLQELSAQEIPVVAPIDFDDGQTIKELQGEGNEKIFYAVFPKVGGRILAEYNDQQLETLGRLIARMHLVGRTATASHRLHINADTFGRENLAYLLQENIIPEEIKERYAFLVDYICTLYDQWVQTVDCFRIHGDCHLGNLLWSEQSCLIVDFDDFMVGPAIQDLWLIVPGREPEDKRQREVLFSAYSSMIDFNYESRRLTEPLRALRLIHFNAWIARRWEDPAFPKIFVDFGSPQYWREQLYALEEIKSLIDTGETLNY